MATENEDFESGSNGANVSTSNSLYDAIVGTFTFTNADPVRGSLCGKFEASASTSGGPYFTLPAAATTYYARAYVKFEEWPTTSPTTVFARFASTSTTRNSLRISTTGVIDLRNINTVVDTAASAETLGEWIRLEWGWTTTTQELRIFRGSNLHGTTPDEVLSGSASSSTANRLFFPSFTTTPSTLTTIYVDDVAWSDTDWLGPTVTAPNLSGTASASASSSAALTGAKDASGTASASATSDATLTGAAAGGDVSGTASASATSDAIVTGSTARSGTASASATSSASLTGSQGGRVFSEGYEGGAAGAAITTGNSGFDVVLNTAATFETSPAPITGSKVGRYATTLDNARTKAILTTGEIRKAFARWYVYLESAPSGVNRFFTFETDPAASPPGEDVAALRWTTGRKIGVFDGSVFTANVSTSTIPLNEWVRLEVAYDRDVGTHGQTIVRIFVGANVHGTTPDEEITVSHVASVSNPVTTTALGTLNAVTQTYSNDAFEVDTTGWIGPVEVKSGTAAASATSSAATTGSSTRSGTASASATSSAALTDSSTRSGTASASATSSAAATGEKRATGTLSASGSSDATLTAGAHVRSGTASASGSSSVALTGTASRSGTASAAASSSVTLTGAKEGGSQNLSGTAAASATSSAALSGAKVASGTAAASGASAAVLSGGREASGTASASAGSAAALSGSKTGVGALSTSAVSDASTVGGKAGIGQISAGAVSQATSSGLKGAVAALIAEAVGAAALVGYGDRFGTASASAVGDAVAVGVNSTGFGRPVLRPGVSVETAQGGARFGVYTGSLEALSVSTAARFGVRSGSLDLDSPAGDLRPAP